MFTTTHFSYFAVAKYDSVAGEKTAGRFTDISGHWAESYINSIADLGIVSGKREGIFAPDDAITRAELTKIAVIAFNLEMDDATDTSFSDVGVSDWFAAYVKAAAQAGWVQGYSTQTAAKVFKPNISINRAEALKILLEAAGFDAEGAEGADFSDTDTASWYMKYVNFAFKNNIVSGYGDGRFGPGNNITRAEAAKVIVKILGMAE